MTPQQADDHRRETIAQLEAEQAADARRHALIHRCPPASLSLWRWLISLLPLFLLLAAISGASTVVLDQDNNRVCEFPWPLDEVIVIHIFVPKIYPPGYIPPKATPTPAPKGTPPPK